MHKVSLNVAAISLYIPFKCKLSLVLRPILLDELKAGIRSQGTNSLHQQAGQSDKLASPANWPKLQTFRTQTNLALPPPLFKGTVSRD